MAMAAAAAEEALLLLLPLLLVGNQAEEGAAAVTAVALARHQLGVQSAQAGALLSTPAPAPTSRASGVEAEGVAAVAAAALPVAAPGARAGSSGRATSRLSQPSAALQRRVVED